MNGMTCILLGWRCTDWWVQTTVHQYSISIAHCAAVVKQLNSLRQEVMSDGVRCMLGVNLIRVLFPYTNLLYL